MNFNYNIIGIGLNWIARCVYNMRSAVIAVYINTLLFCKLVRACYLGPSGWRVSCRAANAVHQMHHTASQSYGFTSFKSESKRINLYLLSRRLTVGTQWTFNFQCTQTKALIFSLYTIDVIRCGNECLQQQSPIYGIICFVRWLFFSEHATACKELINGWYNQ